MQDFSQKKINDLQLDVMSNCVNVKKRVFKKGEYILSFGLKKKIIGLVSIGNADIVRIDINGKEQIIKKLTPGSIFNDAFLNFSKDSIFVISRTDTEIFFIDYPIIFKNCPMNCQYHFQMIDILLELITENTCLLNEKIEILSYSKIRERIMAFLIMAIGNKESKSFTIPFTYTEFADFLSVDRSSLMRELKNMESDKIIKKENKTITLLTDEHY